MPTKQQRLIASLPGLTWLALGLALFCWRDLFWILGAWRPVVLELFLLAFGSAFMLSLRAWLLFPPEAPNHQIAWQLSEGTSSCFLVSLGMFMGAGIVSAIAYGVALVTLVVAALEVTCMLFARTSLEREQTRQEEAMK